MTDTLIDAPTRRVAFCSWCRQEFDVVGNRTRFCATDCLKKRERDSRLRFIRCVGCGCICPKGASGTTKTCVECRPTVASKRRAQYSGSQRPCKECSNPIGRGGRGKCSPCNNRAAKKAWDNSPDRPICAIDGCEKLSHFRRKWCRAATVTLATSNQARQTHEISELRSFFVTGTLRQLENRGDEPGRLTLATKSGLYPVPSVDTTIVERAAGFLSDNRNVVLAISGQGEFDGKGRLKRLTHLTDMQAIDRQFNPDHRLAELASLTDSPIVQARIDRARPAIERAVLATGRAPGLFIDEEDQLEARWLVRRAPDSPPLVVNVSFGTGIEMYVFDRSSGEVTDEATYDENSPLPGDLIADFIRRTVERAND